MKKILLSILMLFILFTSFRTVHASLTRNITFDLDAYDNVGALNASTISGAVHRPIGSSNCYKGGCYTYDGGDYIDYGANDFVDEGNDFTYRCMVWTNTTSGWDYFIGQGDNTASGGFRSGFANTNEWAIVLAGLTSLKYNDNPTANQWFMFTHTYDSGGGTNTLYINGSVSTLKSGTDQAIGNVGTTHAMFGGYYESGFQTSWIGLIDECVMWDETLTATSVLNDYQNLTNETAAPPAPPVGGNGVNTTIFVSNFSVEDFNFSTTDFFNVKTIEFNTTDNVNLTVLSSLNIKKNSVPATTNNIIGRILVDGTIQTEELLRSVTNLNEIGSTGFNPIKFQVASGSHNITIQFSRTSNGIIEIQNFDIVLMQFVTLEGNTVRNQLDQGVYSHDQTDFTNGFNFTIVENVTDIFIFNKQNINTSSSTESSYHFNHVQDGENSSNVFRSLFSNTEIGSIGNMWLHNSPGINQNFTISSRTTLSPITVNTTVLNFDLKDNSNNTVPFFSVSNDTTDLNTNLSLSAGTHELIRQNHLMRNGTGLFLSSIISFKSNSDSFTPTFFINSTNSSISCNAKKDRFLSNNTDIGNAYMLTNCDGSLVKGSGYNFNLYVTVPTGETLIILDESLHGFETSPLNLSDISLTKSLQIQTNLTNNTVNFNAQNLSFFYNLTIGEFNGNNLFTCDFNLNGTVNQTQFNITGEQVSGTLDNHNFTVDFGQFSGNVSLEINCSNNEVSNTTGLYWYNIDTIIPVIQSDFSNNTDITNGNTVTFNVNFTDSNLFAYNISWFDVNGVLIQDYFVENLTVNFASNTSTYVTTTDGNNYSIRARSWDSHTTLAIKDYKVDSLVNGLEFEDKIKIYGDNVTSTDNIKLIDKYNFEFQFEKGITWKTIYLESDSKLTYLPNSNYPLHFVDFNNKKWIDFDSSDYTDYKIEQLSNNKWKLEFRSEDNQVIQFNSIGDLNVNEKVYYYNVNTPSTAVNLTGIETQLQTFNNNFEVLTMMTGVIVLLGIFIFAGIIMRNFYLWMISSASSFIISTVFFSKYAAESTNALYKISAWSFLGFGIMLLAVAWVLAIIQHRNDSNILNEKDFYDGY